MKRFLNIFLKVIAFCLNNALYDGNNSFFTFPSSSFKDTEIKYFELKIKSHLSVANKSTLGVVHKTLSEAAPHHMRIFELFVACVRYYEF